MSGARSPSSAVVAAAGWPRFAAYAPEESRAVATVQRAILVVVALQLAIGALSGYRAVVQVRRLELAVNGRVLRAGSAARAEVVSSGRVPVDLRLELVQGAHAETLAARRVPANRWSFYDPRSRTAALSVALDPAVLARYRAGPALLRATARGRMQFLREPPPAVREAAVVLDPPTPPRQR